MRGQGLIRGVVFAAFCAAASVILPQAASAVIVTNGSIVRLNFDAYDGTGSFDTVDMHFLYGADDDFAAPDAFNVQLFSSSNDALGGATVEHGATSATFDKVSVSPFYAIVTGLAGSFDLVSANSDLLSGGALVANVPDAVATPIPASLPLFLTGALLVYGLVRRRKGGQLFAQPA